MNKTKVKVDQKTVDYIQRLHFEVESRKDIVQRIIEAHSSDVNSDVISSDTFNHYQNELSDYAASYELAKQEMAETYIPAELLDKGVSWNLDFSSGILTINGVVDEKK